MVDESSALLPPVGESIKEETDLALESESESGEPTPATASEPDFVCDCEEWMRSGGRRLSKN